MGIAKRDAGELFQIWRRSSVHSFVTFVSFRLHSVSAGVLFVPNLPISWFYISSHWFNQVIRSVLHRVVTPMPILAYSLLQNLILFNRVLIKILFTYLTKRSWLLSFDELVVRRSQRIDTFTRKRMWRKCTLNLSNLFLVWRRVHAGFMAWEDAALVHIELIIALFFVFIYVIPIFFNQTRCFFPGLSRRIVISAFNKDGFMLSVIDLIVHVCSYQWNFK